MKEIATILSLLFIQSCTLLSMGDGVMVVAGDISAFNETQCQLEIKTESEKVLYKFEISGRFKQDFTVAPYKRDYLVNIICNGQIIYTNKLTYLRDIEAGGVLNVGILKT